MVAPRLNSGEHYDGKIDEYLNPAVMKFMLKQTGAAMVQDRVV